MQITPINNSQNFKGISKPILTRMMLDNRTIYKEILEYRPFKDETNAEIQNMVKKLSDAGNGVENKVILGKVLNCTKEAADFIMKNIK